MKLWKNLFTAYGKAKYSFPTSCKQVFPQSHIQASYTHFHNAYADGLLLFPIFPINN